MKQLQSHARIVLSEPDRVVDELCRHMTEHNANVVETEDARILRFKNSSVRFSRDGDATVVDIRSTDIEGIYFTRMAVASHIQEFSTDAPPPIEWHGDGGELVRPPNFQILEVCGIRDITPHMRRLTLTGEDVARFVPLDALHLNVLIQKPGLVQPQWPTVGPDGMIRWPDPDLRPDFRKYTVRSVDIEAGTLDIDFVLHADAGPGSALAEQAKIGDRFGIAGPGGGGLVEADWHLFAGDETALPAIARMLEALPQNAAGKVLLEVANKQEVQTLARPQNIELLWLLRNDSSAAHQSLLVDAVVATEMPSDGRRIYVWTGCEYADFRRLRHHYRNDLGLRKDQHLAVAYWRRGESGS